MILTIDTKNPQAKALVEYLRTLEFVSIKEDFEIPEWHKEAVKRSHQEYLTNPESAQPWREVLKDIEQKLDDQRFKD